MIKALVFKEKIMILQNFQLSLETLKKFKNLCPEAAQFFEEIKVALISNVYIKVYANQFGAKTTSTE